MSRQPIALGSSESRSKPLNAARLVNFYSEPAPRNSRAPAYNAGVLQGPINGPFYGTPGQKAFLATLGPSIRAARFALNFMYVLSGANLYQVSQTGTATLCTGDTITSFGYAMMTDNGVQLTVLAGGPAGISYVVVGTTISQITSSAYPAAGVSSIDTIDGYTIFATAPGGSTLYGVKTTITNITAANPAVVADVAHPYNDNDQVLITGVNGMTQVNGRTFTILVVDADHFQLVGIDSSGYSGYTFGGTAQKVTAQATGQWFISALYDSASIDALQFASAESSPDPLVRIFVNNRDVLLFGAETIEPWQDAGAAPFPFQRVTGAIIQRGCIAPLSVARLATTVFWLGDDHIVYMMNGYTPQRVSTFPMEEILRDAEIVSDAVGMTYSMGGHQFYVLTLPAANRTLCFDLATQSWHERQSGTSIIPAAWNVNAIVSCWDNVYVGTSDGAVSQLDLDTFSDLGTPIRSVAVTPPFYPDGKRAAMTTVELECELGVGTATGGPLVSTGVASALTGFTVPALNATANTVFTSVTGFFIGDYARVLGAGDLLITNIAGTTVTLKNVGQPGTAAPGTVIGITVVQSFGASGLDPLVMVRFSDDGGATFSNQRTCSIRKTGDRIDRAIVRKLGLFRQRQLEFSISDPVKRCFYGLRVEGATANS